MVLREITIKTNYNYPGLNAIRVNIGKFPLGFPGNNKLYEKPFYQYQEQKQRRFSFFMKWARLSIRNLASDTGQENFKATLFQKISSPSGTKNGKLSSLDLRTS